MNPTNLHMIQSILEHNYDTRYTNKHFKNQNIIRIVKSITTMCEQHVEWDMNSSLFIISQCKDFKL